MPDVYDTAKRSEVMRAVRSKGTTPELLVRRLLHRLGCRFRLHREDLPGRPDIVLPRRRRVVLVHGCFWHQHPGCKHAARPSTNTAFWNRKLDRNVERDAAQMAALRSAGWRVLVVWECQTRNQDELVRILARFLREVPPTRGRGKARRTAG